MRKFTGFMVLAMILGACTGPIAIPAPTPAVVQQTVVVTVMVPVSQEITSTPAPTNTLVPTVESTPGLECVDGTQIAAALQAQLEKEKQKLKGWNPVFGAELMPSSGESCLYALTLAVHKQGERNTEIYRTSDQVSVESLVKSAFQAGTVLPFEWVEVGQKWSRQPFSKTTDGNLFGGYLLYLKKSVH